MRCAACGLKANWINLLYNAAMIEAHKEGQVLRATRNVFLHGECIGWYLDHLNKGDELIFKDSKVPTDLCEGERDEDGDPSCMSQVDVQLYTITWPNELNNSKAVVRYCKDCAVEAKHQGAILEPAGF